ncbi:glutaredoxin family protein [Trichothermofontia sp.]
MNRRFWLRSIFRLLLIILAGWGFLPTTAQANTNRLDIYFFHSETCPHCREQMPLMIAIDQYNDDITVHRVEVSQEPQVWQAFRDRHGIRTGAVPRTFIGDQTFIGYSPEDGPLEYVPAYEGYIGYRNQILAAIATAVGHEVRLTAESSAVKEAGSDAPTPSTWRWWVLGLPVLYGLTFFPLHVAEKPLQTRRYWFGGLAALCLLSLFGLIHLTPDTAIQQFAQEFPFPLLVAIVALADGFNPCAFTVLVILLSLLTYTKKRRDMAIVGSTFIATSAVMYFLFILLMIVVGSVLLEQYDRVFLTILGIGVTIAGFINLKDYLWLKQGVSLSFSETQQRTVSQKAGQIVRQLRAATGDRLQFIAALGGTIALAILVNLIELGCTAIYPLFT